MADRDLRSMPVGAFKPVWLDPGLPDLGPEPGRYYDDASLWWRHKRPHRGVLVDYANRAATLRGRIATLEEDFQAQVSALASSAGEDSGQRRAALTAAAFTAVARAEGEVLTQLQRRPAPDRRNWLYRRAWAGFDKAAHRTAGA